MSTRRPKASRRSRSPRPGQSLCARAAEVVEEQRTRMADNLGSAVDGRDPDGVHDMRVASRRLRAQLQVFGPWLDPDTVQRLRTAARRVTRALGPVREIDVMRLALAALQRRAQPLRALAIEQLDSRLVADRRRARARMMKRFAKIDLDDFEERLRALVAALRHAGAHGLALAPAASAEAAAGSETLVGAPTMLDLMQAVAPEVLEHARRMVSAELGGELGSAADREALHRVRIEAKKLRYILEVLTPDLGASGKKLVRRLRKLQDKLGDFHDDVVLDAALADATGHAARDDQNRLAAELGRLRAARKRSILAAERACRREIEALRTGGFPDAIREALVDAGALPRDARVKPGSADSGPDADRPPAGDAAPDDGREPAGDAAPDGGREARRAAAPGEGREPPSAGATGDGDGLPRAAGPGDGDGPPSAAAPDDGADSPDAAPPGAGPESPSPADPGDARDPAARTAPRDRARSPAPDRRRAAGREGTHRPDPAETTHPPQEERTE